MGYILIIVCILFIVAVAIRDIFFNKKHTIQHNFPVVGHLRYLLELIGPELRQYWVANNREERPFNRGQRSWIFASSKKQNNYQAFGTDDEITEVGHTFIKQSAFPYVTKEEHPNYNRNDFVPSAKVIGEYHNRKKPYRPKSIINISAMSYGSLSAKAIQSMNMGAIDAECYHNTGEGGLSEYHKNGADVVFQFGTGYFGVRDENGNFSMNKLVELVEKNSCIKAIEIKLSQGAKPGKGGVLPASKITKEISEIRGVPMGKDVISPSYHSAFDNTIKGLVEFIEQIASRTGLPVGIKSAVGKIDFWESLAMHMRNYANGPDFITIDGGEGGTGAAPPSFANHVSLPFTDGFSRVYKVFSDKKLTDKIVFIGGGKLGLPSSAVMAFAMGVDIINVGREAMMSIGCIQAQRCHTNHCPAGIATQSKWLQAGIDTNLKANRFYHYIKSLRKEILDITHACGYEHPCQLDMRDVEVVTGDRKSLKTLSEIYEYQKDIVKFNGVKSLVE